MTDSKGQIYKVTGPVVVAKDMKPQMNDVVKVGEEGLMGEVIQIEGEKTYIQVYEDTTGVKPGEPVENTEQPLSVDLGPGLLGSIYDGLQRPLQDLQEKTGDFIERGEDAPGIDPDKNFEFESVVEEGDEVEPGDVLGTTEVKYGEHKIMLPPHYEGGEVEEINEGNYSVNETVAVVEGQEISMRQEWPIRDSRPVDDDLKPEIPLITGQRVLDGLFPIAKGGTAAIPGPFGSGKTVTQQSLAKFSDADIIVYIGCGERGNEMTEVLEEFPELEDPQTGDKIINRTVLIANTSNMPVAAREASIYTGVTIAEYFRDQGLDVALMADSTSRWAEAMREISARLEEMPGERGYPAYLSSKLAEFYERAGRADPLGLEDDPGSVSIVGAVSPPGGDFSEPVTQNTLRVVKNFWALDADLAEKRHFPSINWDDSYSGYADMLSDYFKDEVDNSWQENIQRMRDILQKDGELQETVQLVGKDALPDRERLTLEIGTMVKQFYLQQNAFHDVDQYSSPEKTFEILELILEWADGAYEALEDGALVEDLVALESKNKVSEMKFTEDYHEKKEEIQNLMEDEFEQVVQE